jgi:hypothetical protein
VYLGAMVLLLSRIFSMSWATTFLDYDPDFDLEFVLRLSEYPAFFFFLLMVSVSQCDEF